MINITQNNFAFQKFLLIVNTYGAFIKLRSSIKQLSLTKTQTDSIKEVRINKSDPYSDYEIGISQSSVDTICGLIDNIPKDIKNQFVDELISTQKLYKKLKHQFKFEFPELNQEMEEELTKHIEFLNIKNLERIHIKNKILKLSDSFINFLNHTVGLCDRGFKISSTHFFRNLVDKYNIDYNKEEINKIIYHIDNNKEYSLTINDIENVAELLAKYLFSFDKVDTINPEMIIVSSDNYSNKDKYETAKSIIHKNNIKFNKLLDNYNQLKDKL